MQESWNNIFLSGKVSFNTHALRINLRDLRYGLYNLGQLRTKLRAGQCILSSFHWRASVLRSCQLSLQLCARSKNACNRKHGAVKTFSIKNTSETFDRQFFLRVLWTQKAWEKHANNLLLYLLFSSKTFSYWFSLTRPDSVSSYFRSEIQKCRFTTQAAFTGINLQSLHWFASILDLSFMKLNLSIKSKVKPHSVLFSKLEKAFCSK